MQPPLEIVKKKMGMCYILRINLKGDYIKWKKDIKYL